MDIFTASILICFALFAVAALFCFRRAAAGGFACPCMSWGAGLERAPGHSREALRARRNRSNGVRGAHPRTHRWAADKHWDHTGPDYREGGN